MSFPEGYSNYMFERSTIGVLIENETLAGSSVTFQLDASSMHETKLCSRSLFYDYYDYNFNVSSTSSINLIQIR
jgi:hypothetical protein